jgi:hypothetical protein
LPPKNARRPSTTPFKLAAVDADRGTLRAWGRRDGPKSIRECKAAMRLDLDTLVWTRGAAFPVSMLEGRLKCPACGSRKVVLLFNLPGRPVVKAAG